MRVGLICRDSIKRIITELFTSREIQADENADIYVVEIGSELPKDKVSIVFDLNNMDPFIELLDKLCKPLEDTADTIIGKSSEDKYEIISYDKIHYFEGRGNNTVCVTAYCEYKVKAKLYELQERLPQNRFIRVSKSLIVNITCVSQIIPWFGRRFVLRFCDSKKEVEVSRSYVKNFKNFLGI
ncbi:MAG: LytTR family transcriptional regulator DNA-binding domain-containing protein [Clostridia bacterium]|nr:LytTR family transcriptional regulator DNA-binding domain-containing protein [Clostridia bacterium]